MKSKKLRLWESAALLALAISLFIAAWAQQKQESISRSLLRLHVVAVSDDSYEQELKLRVRDGVLEYISPLLQDSDDSNSAEDIIAQNLEGIAQRAYELSEGRQVTVSLGPEDYPSREYEGFTLPAGNYRSLRIVLGEGEGKNWWCIVFPPLCLSAAQAQQLETVMSQEDYAIISGQQGYELRFKIVELWGKLQQELGL